MAEVNKKSQTQLEDIAFKRMLDKVAERNTDLSPEAAQELVNQVIKEDRQKQRTH